MLLELNDQEREALTEVLGSFLSELKTEIHHTDRHSYRVRLQDQDQRLRQILSRLDHQVADVALDAHHAA